MARPLARIAPPAPTAAKVAVHRLALSEFRSYARLRLDIDDRPVVLTGPNGAGKTNLLEALSFLVPGRGLARARLAEVTRRGAEGAGWAVSATVATPAGAVEIGTGLAPAPEPGERRVVRIDGAPAESQAALAAHVAAIWLTPAMDRLFLDGAAARRRFLDRLVFGFDTGHAARLTAYERAMRERTRILRERGAESAWLTALEAQMAESGVAAAAARRDIVARLDAACAAGTGPFPAAGLALAGELEAALDARPALEVEEAFRARLAALRGCDAEAGRATAGPHRSDLRVRHLAKDQPAEACSTGEQKAVLLAIVLAEARLVGLERAHVPLLLLDEVAAHLDAARRAALFDEICAAGAQAWLTGTDASAFAPLGPRAQWLRVADGTVHPAP